jgi:hypothetical protein
MKKLYMKEKKSFFNKNRFLFGSDSSFLNAAYNSPLYCALQVCFFPHLPEVFGKSLRWEEKRRSGRIKDYKSTQEMANQKNILSLRGT